MGTRRSRSIELADWVVARDKAVAARFGSTPHPGQKPLTRNHIRYQTSIETHPVTLCVGPAGTGKSRLACQTAIKLLREGRIGQIVLTRPLVTCDEYLGPVPGTEAEKLAPYVAPLVKSLIAYLGVSEYDKLVRNETILVRSLAAMRGESFQRAFVICDEAENASYGQLRMILTRAGDEACRMVINGDITQADVNPGNTNPLAQVILKLHGVAGVNFVKMTRADCLRPELVQHIDERLAGGP